MNFTFPVSFFHLQHPSQHLVYTYLVLLLIISSFRPTLIDSSHFSTSLRQLRFSQFSPSESKMNYWSVVPFDGELFICNRVWWYHKSSGLSIRKGGGDIDESLRMHHCFLGHQVSDEQGQLKSYIVRGRGCTLGENGPNFSDLNRP